ncbi:uncharacterized protein LOC123656287 [Melitaea cinxia]|uniref:uncharacterized protein LOC123656287 n=1 Tax=Melitaea cinxia TaxID=113334 RepID=UPI001E273DF2|nr:uncharacterized protein LOC123656287 [Melitaea cinxia]
MNRILIALLVTCALTAAMVPRHRRDIHKDKVNEGTEPEEFCAPTTPCAWGIYNPTTKHIELNVTNTYCVCQQGELCLVAENDKTANAFIYQCQHRKH